ncbi:DUF6615 family protein [Flavobacterium sp. FlaQc-52]|jgi:hypothetical protein|uniref:DUF6615 family protein n=1 Tax=Flavobacterium sp. FlaQc-52 TaxID=3374185 RepID=UPI003757A02C
MICQSIKTYATEVFQWISKQNEVGEESITDWGLYRASELDGRIQYLQFNRHQEAKFTGADFELWILSNTIYFKARVQAKRLRAGKDLYSSISQSNTYGLQIDKLIEDANKGDFRPLYAFYNNENHMSQCGKNVIDEGIYLADANLIYNDIFSVPKRVIDSAHLISKSTPFSCWFCCPLSKFSTNKNFLDFLENYFPSQNEDSSDGVTNKFPNYITALLRLKKENDLKLDYDFQNEFRNLDNVNAILLIDNRKD